MRSSVTLACAIVEGNYHPVSRTPRQPLVLRQGLLEHRELGEAVRGELLALEKRGADTAPARGQTRHRALGVFVQLFRRLKRLGA